MAKIWDSYQQIIWDWNGTILDDVSVCLDIINDCLERRKLPLLTLDRYLEIFDFPVITYYQQLGFDFERESFEAVGMEFIKAYQTRMFECPLHRQSLPILNEIKRRGVPQFVLSALQVDNLHKVLQHFNLTGFFHEIRGVSDHYAWGKVELGKALIQDHGKPHSKAVLLGDTTHDHETARAIGIDCVLLASGHNSYSRLKACGVPVFHTLEGLSQADF